MINMNYDAAEVTLLPGHDKLPDDLIILQSKLTTNRLTNAYARPRGKGTEAHHYLFIGSTVTYTTAPTVCSTVRFPAYSILASANRPVPHCLGAGSWADGQ